MYAVVRTGGKQYRVEEGRSVQIERLTGEAGDSIELSDVLLLGEGEQLTVGAPLVTGARVVGRIAEQGRAKKVIVFRYKAKTRARKKNGHRQQYTRLVIEEILGPGQQPKPKVEVTTPAEAAAEGAPKARRRRAKAAEAEAGAATAPATGASEPAAPPEASESPAAPARRRRTRSKEE
ncbi:MAG TPA: 50S ribosomal protein L21 [Dehalococcoidia bacterium]|nr:50S ribosomal protein L21 [Dehalococcoidia bacterium]